LKQAESGVTPPCELDDDTTRTAKDSLLDIERRVYREAMDRHSLALRLSDFLLRLFGSIRGCCADLPAEWAVDSIFLIIPRPIT